MPFSIKDKHTIKVLRQQKLHGATKIPKMFPNKNWRLSGVKTVLSKIDATGSVERCSGVVVGWQSWYDKRHCRQTVGSELHRLRGVGDPTRVCVQAPPDHGPGRAAPACRGGIGPSGPGSNWQRDQWMAQATDSLRCSRQRTFWTFSLNITALFT